MAAPKQLALPFAVQMHNRKEPFSGEAEAAAVFALSELGRKNSGLSGKQEKLDYVTKVGYPLWLIVHGSATYVFDGLNKSNYMYSFYEASQTEFVVKDFESIFRIREEYVDFLHNYEANIKQAINKKEVPCRGLIANGEFLGELNSYRKESAEIYSQQPSLGLIAPVLKESEVVAVVNQIEALQSSFREKTEKMSQLMELISKTTKRYIEGLQFESKAVKEELDAKIKAQKEIINPKIQKLTDQYRIQVERLSKNIEKETLPFEKQKSRLEKGIKEAEDSIERFSRQAKTQSNKGNKRSEDSLKKKIKKEKKELDEFKKQHKSVEKQLKKLNEQKTDETFRLKSEYDEKVQSERQPIVALEVLWDKKLEAFIQETQKLEKLTEPVLEELSKFVAQRKSILSKTEPLSLEVDPKLKNTTLLHVPFYVVAYQSSSDSKRYLVLAPSIVGSLGFSAKLKGALGRAKIKELLNSRFKAVSNLGEKLYLNLTSSSEFEAQTAEIAQKNNLLSMEAQVKNGLSLLKDEGWLSENEHQTLLLMYNNIKQSK
jgi:hypothetical protein